MIRNIAIIALLLYCASTWTFTLTGYKQFMEPSFSATETKEMEVAALPPPINPVKLPRIAGIN